MTALLSRRLMLAPGEPAALCARLRLRLPPGFGAAPGPVGTDELIADGSGAASVATSMAVACSPRVGVLVTSTVGDVAAAYGVRGELGASLIRAGSSPVELSAWPAQRLGAELARTVPPIGRSSLPLLHLPLADVTERPEVRDVVIGRLRATVAAPPRVLGLVLWLATAEGWLAVEPAQVRDGVRWATVRPADPVDLGAALAPLVAAGLS